MDIFKISMWFALKIIAYLRVAQYTVILFKFYVVWKIMIAFEAVLAIFAESCLIKSTDLHPCNSCATSGLPCLSQTSPRPWRQGSHL